MKTSIKALVLALSMIAGSSFAATDMSSISDFSAGAQIDGFEAAAGKINDLLLLDTGASANADENNAVVVQFGNSNYAAIDQLGLGNVATILQDSANQTNNAFVQQTGDKNVAQVFQR